ncbi:hypothetical protein, partial [Pseudomonas viridiflava]|uniref:hypothetical protein n=1 Tax=Pseudomonas viridiflava TaxID=33069 RepID=UPI0013DF80EE
QLHLVAQQRQHRRPDPFRLGPGRRVDDGGVRLSGTDLELGRPAAERPQHQIKAYGFYQSTDQFMVGGNLLVASGRPKNCIGNLPQSYYDAGNDATGYGSEFFFCNNQAAPRGSRGRMPWDARLDLNVAYTPTFLKGLVLRADVFN